MAIRLGAVIIANAIVWGAVIIGCSAALKGTGNYELIKNYLAMGPTITTMLIFVGMVPFKKRTVETPKSDSAPAE